MTRVIADKAKPTFVPLVLFLAALAACGSGDELSPVERCDALVNDICTRAVECIGGSQEECVEFVREDFACAGVQGVKPTYDRCVEQINVAKCSVLFGEDPYALPTDCQGVFAR